MNCRARAPISISAARAACLGRLRCDGWVQPPATAGSGTAVTRRLYFMAMFPGGSSCRELRLGWHRCCAAIDSPMLHRAPVRFRLFKHTRCGRPQVARQSCESWPSMLDPRLVVLGYVRFSIDVQAVAQPGYRGRSGREQIQPCRLTFRRHRRRGCGRRARGVLRTAQRRARRAARAATPRPARPGRRRRWRCGRSTGSPARWPVFR